MTCFKKVCEKLKVMPADNPHLCEIDREANCNNDFLLEQVEKKNMSFASSFNLIGCFEIGQLAGNEIVRVLLDFFNSERFQRGKQICLNVNKHSVAMLVFSKVSLRFCAPTNPNEIDINAEYKGLYTKLFNDKRVESFQRGPHMDLYKQELINNYRQEAKDLFCQFLSSKIAGFTHVEHRNCFLGLVAKCAFRMSSIDPVREVNDEVEKVPFLACIEIAFRTGKTGMISNLLGELRRRSNDDDNETLNNIGSVIIDKSRALIYEAFKIDRSENDAFIVVGGKLFDEEATERIAEHVRDYYGIARIGD